MKTSLSAIHKDNDIFKCEKCHHKASWLELRAREFNALRCAKCNGPMRLVTISDSCG